MSICPRYRIWLICRICTKGLIWYIKSSTWLCVLSSWYCPRSRRRRRRRRGRSGGGGGHGEPGEPGTFLGGQQTHTGPGDGPGGGSGGGCSGAYPRAMGGRVALPQPPPPPQAGVGQDRGLPHLLPRTWSAQHCLRRPCQRGRDQGGKEEKGTKT